jgi:hypothetical protein
MSTGISPSELVRKAEDILKKAKESEELEKAKPPRERKKVKFWDQTSQLRNLVQIAQTETEVSVLQNFIHYQIGRRSTREFWALLGADVIAALEDIDKATSSSENAVQARERAVRNFFGYLVRHYVYMNETQKPDDRSMGDQATPAGRRP